MVKSTVSEEVVLIKIAAVAASVRKHTVQNDLNPFFVGKTSQMGEVLFRPQKFIDLLVIRCIIAVIRPGFKNGI